MKIPQALREQGAMLANPSKNTHPDVHQAVGMLNRQGTYTFDIKWDGIRCLAYIEDGDVQLINRRGVNITYRYPDVVEAMRSYTGHDTIVLDGEIVCLGANGLPDFARVHRRDAQASDRAAAALVRSMPATFMAFDLLSLGGDDLRNQQYTVRRALLTTVARAFPDGVQASMINDDGEAMWKVILEQGMEGLIAKRKNSTYRAGRSPAWIKLKPTHRLTAMVCGVDAGKGWRADSFGALQLALLCPADSTLVQIGRVGSGFTTADLALVQKALENPPLLVEVEFQEVSPDRQLRFPVFKGIRDDVTVLDCTTAQLDTAPTQDWR